MSFSIDIEKFAKKTQSSLSEASRAIKIALFNGIIRDTRVDTGRLRGNWQTSTGSPITSVIERLDSSEQGNDGGSAQQEVLEKVTPFGVDYLTNNLPYAQVWEERDGMVSRNMTRIARTVREVVSEKRK